MACEHVATNHATPHEIRVDEKLDPRDSGLSIICHACIEAGPDAFDFDHAVTLCVGCTIDLIPNELLETL